MRKIALLLLLLLAFTSVGAARSVGVFPATIDAGTIERGQTKEVTFYLTASGFDEPFPVSPRVTRPLYSRILGSGGVVDPEDFSEEGVADWTRFTRPEFMVDPQNPFNVSANGLQAIAVGEMTLLISVPLNAEPGYHAASIDINPRISGDGAGAGSSVLGQSVPRFVFRVPGNADRSLEVTNVQAYRTGETVVELFATVTNTGTVTTTVRGGEITIRDPRRGNVLDTITFGTHTIAPGGQKTVTKRWRGGNIAGGQYQLTGSLDYMTGEASITGNNVFTIPDIVEVVPSNVTGGTDDPASAGSPFPLPLALMVLALVGVLMYSFEIDPVWIVSIVGFLAVSAVILGTGIPDYTIAILLMIAGGLFYIA